LVLEVKGGQMPYLPELRGDRPSRSWRGEGVFGSGRPRNLETTLQHPGALLSARP